MTHSLLMRLVFAIHVSMAFPGTRRGDKRMFLVDVVLGPFEHRTGAGLTYVDALFPMDTMNADIVVSCDSALLLLVGTFDRTVEER